VILIVNLNNAPWVGTTANLAVVWGKDFSVRANNSEWDFASDLFMFSDSFFILVLVSGRLEDTNVVVLNVRKDLKTGVM
jgi:hypothetical protein